MNTGIIKYGRLIVLFLIIFFGVQKNYVFSQCPQLYDGTGTLSSNPYWIDCVPGDYTLFIQSNQNIGPYTVDWGDGSPVSTGSSLVPPASVDHIYTATIDTFIVTFTETSTGCVITGVVVMERTPSASIQIPVGDPVYGCTPATFNFINASTNISPTTTFTWDFGDGSSVEVYDYTNLGQTVSHTYLPGTANCNVTVTLTAVNYCNQITPSSNTYYPIQVWDIDDASITASNTLLCYPDTTVSFTNTTDRNCYAYGNTAQRFEYWNFGNYWGVGHDSIVGWRPWSPPNWGAIVMNYPGIGVYNVMLIDSSYCGLDTAYITVVIVPPPVAGLSASPDSICEGQSITFTNHTAGGANSFLWHFGNGNTSTAANPPPQTYNTAGVYNVVLEVNITGGTPSCYDSDTIQVTVLPAPHALFTTSNNVACDSLTVIFTDQSTSGSPIITWNWTFGNGNYSSLASPPPQFYNVLGTHNASLTVTAQNGCSDTEIHPITIHPSPHAAFTAANVCLGQLAHFTDISTVSVGTITGWHWVFGNGQTSNQQNPNTTYTTPGTVSIILTVSTAYCSNSDTMVLVIEPLPTPAFTPSTNIGCPPLTVTFTNNTTGATTYNWNFGDGTYSSLANPSHIFTNYSPADIVYHVKLIAHSTFGCTDSISHDITIHPLPHSSFYSNAVPGCSPLTVNFTNSSVGSVSQIWDFGDGTPNSTAANPTHTFVNDTTFIQFFEVHLIALSSFGCADTSSQFITVYPNLDYQIIVLPDTSCHPSNVSLSATPGGISYNWNFGDGYVLTGGANVSHIYTNLSNHDTTFTVTLITTSYFTCLDTSTEIVVINPSPTASFNIASATGCTPFTVTISNQSIGALHYSWRFGDGTNDTTSSPVFTHNYINTISTPSNYNIRLIVKNAYGCADTLIKQITVYPEVVAQFTSDTAGCSPYNVQFTDQSIGSSYFLWNFGDGNSTAVQNPSHQYINPSSNDTIYHVMFIPISAYACRDTAYRNITVYALPHALFTVSPGSQTYPNTTVMINNLSTSGSWNYLWDFGDSTTTTLNQPIMHTYSTWGTYTITLIVSGTHCSDTISQTIQIIAPLPIAAFDSSAEGCSPLTVTFVNHSQFATDYLWDFGDGNTSTVENPSHTYVTPGVYIVQLTAAGPGGQNVAANVSVTVFKIPTALFTVDPTIVILPDQPVHCYNLSLNAVSYLWNFGDGATSTDVNPIHQYTQVGVYDITLQVTSEHGCEDVYVLQSAVTAKTSGNIIFPNAFTPNSTGPNGGYFSNLEHNNDVFHPVCEGVEKYKLNIFNRWGELIFESTDVNIGWDGYYRDKLCKQDVYVWKAIGKFSNGDLFTMAGDVTLLK